MRYRGALAWISHLTSSARRLKRETVVVTAYLVLAVIGTYPLALHAGDAIPVGGDSWSNYWNLWWVKTALVDRHVSPYFAPDLHFPYGATLYLHTLNLAGGVISLPVTTALGIPAGYNFLVLLSFVLSGYGTYRLALYMLSLHNPGHESGPAAQLAAFVAGVGFTFSSYRYTHLLGHLDLASTQWLPLSILFLLKARDAGGPRNVAMAALFLVVTTLTTYYYGLFLLVFIAGLLIELIARRPNGGSRQLLRIFAVGSVFLIGVSPVLLPMLILGQSSGRASDVPLDIARFSTDALAFFIPSPLHPLLGPTTLPFYEAVTPDGENETIAFLGFVPIVLGAFGLRRCPALRQSWLPVVVLFLLLALGPVMHVAGQVVVPWLSPVMPYSLLAHLPYGDIPRVPARFVVMAMLCLSVIVGAGAWTLIRPLTTRKQVAVTAMLTVLTIGENAVLPLPLMSVNQPVFFKQVRDDPTRAGILEIPIRDGRADIPERMLYQTIHQKPIYGGYYSRAMPALPFGAVPGFGQFATLSDDIDDVVVYRAEELGDISRAVLNFYEAGHVVIERKFLASALYAPAHAIADRVLGASRLVYENSVVSAYAVPPRPPDGPPAVWLDTGWSYLERLPDAGPDRRPLRWRWMGAQARLGVLAWQPVRARLRFIAQAFGRARRLQLAADGSVIAMMPISPDRTTYETGSFQLTPDMKFLDLRSLDGAESPGVDRRLLSVALYRLELVVQ